MAWELSLREAVSMGFVLIGTGFMFISALGILRMPDLFLRMSMTTKASTLGVGSMLLGFIVYFSYDVGAVARAGATIVFVLLTAPISAHMIGRAGYINEKTELWSGTHIDELQGHYDPEHRTLRR